MIPYNPLAWFWLVQENNKFYSSAAQGYVDTAPEVYTPIDTFDNLVQVLRDANVPPYHLVAKRVIVDRLEQAGLLTAARTALDAADLYTQERWNTRDRIYADDPAAVGLIQAIGGDPAVILAWSDL